MPGLFGILLKTKDVSRADLERMGRRMAEALATTSWLKTESWADDNFCGGRVHLGVLNPASQPMTAASGSAKVWFDGELYPETSETGMTPTADEALRLIENPKDRLKELDGCFALVSYDAAKEEVVLATDQLGYRPLYIMETGKWVAYASEVKALLAVSETLPEIDEIGLRQFFGFSYMLGERTWWKNIKLVPPACIMRIRSEKIETQRYWSFAEIQSDPQPEKDVLKLFGELWSLAVRQRSRPGVTPLLLSGGLDSRLLLAELRRCGRDAVTITFGDLDSMDMNIARSYAKVAGVPHIPREINSGNWWNAKKEHAIWATDGMITAQDLHVSVALDDLHQGNWCSPHNMAGDVIFGGSKLSPELSRNWKQKVDDVLRLWFLSNPFFEKEEVVEASIPDVKDYLNGPSYDCFQVAQRQRKRTLYGTVVTAPYSEPLYPSMSLPLLKLAFGALTDQQRMYSVFYNKFLVSEYPEFFASIPQLDSSRFGNKILEKAYRAVAPKISGQRHFRTFLRAGHFIPTKPFVDYRTIVNPNDFRQKLLAKDLLADQLTNGKIGAVLKGESGTNLSLYALIAVLTLETYLGQAANLQRT